MIWFEQILRHNQNQIPGDFNGNMQQYCRLEKKNIKIRISSLNLILIVRFWFYSFMILSYLKYLEKWISMPGTILGTPDVNRTVMQIRVKTI